MDHVVAAVELHLKKGDALMFVDTMSHSASTRTNPGERRIAIFNTFYTVLGAHTRPALYKNYTPSRLDALTPAGAPKGVSAHFLCPGGPEAVRGVRGMAFSINT